MISTLLHFLKDVDLSIAVSDISGAQFVFQHLAWPQPAPVRRHDGSEAKGIVDDNSRREMACPEDRLVALAGVASELSKIRGETYIAGTWGRCSLRHLGFQSAGMSSKDKAGVSTRTPEHAMYTSPSWSWAEWSFDS